MQVVKVYPSEVGRGDACDFEMMLATLVYLMTQYATNPDEDPLLARGIAAHILDLVENYPETPLLLKKNLLAQRQKWLDKAEPAQLAQLSTTARMH